MILNSFSIKGLYGAFSYDFELPESESIFLITGPNGYGKTTILEILYNLSNKNLIYFYRLPFTEIRIKIDGRYALSIDRIPAILKDSENSESDEKVVLDKAVRFSWIEQEKEICQFLLDNDKISKALKQVGFYIGNFYDSMDYSSDEFEKFVKNNPSFYDRIAKNYNYETFMLMLSSYNSIKFVKAQRLYTHTEKKSTFTIEVVMDNFARRINDDYVAFLKKMQQNDSRLIEVLLTSGEQYDEKTYNGKCNSLKPYVDRIKFFGLNDSVRTYPFSIENSKVLSAHVDGLVRLVEQFKEEIDKYQLFYDLLSRKKFTNKIIEFSHKNGMRIRSANNDFFIPASKLSSGEQNEIIMLYNFIFEVPDNSILLIDEPEISLHVMWQQSFIDDIEEIAKLKKCQVIVATHSPQLIGGRWDKCFDLYENGAEQLQ